MRTRTVSWDRVKKEKNEGESKRSVSKAVFAKFGRKTNKNVNKFGNNMK